MSWVWKNSRSRGIQRLVLLSIADQANDAGEAWPSVASIAARCQISERSVQRNIRYLADLEELAVEPRERENGGCSSNLYRVLAS